MDDGIADFCTQWYSVIPHEQPQAGFLNLVSAVRIGPGALRVLPANMAFCLQLRQKTSRNTGSLTTKLTTTRSFHCPFCPVSIASIRSAASCFRASITCE